MNFIVTVLENRERMKNGVSSRVSALTLEPFHQRFFKFKYVVTDDKMEVIFNIGENVWT